PERPLEQPPRDPQLGPGAHPAIERQRRASREGRERVALPRQRQASSDMPSGTSVSSYMKLAEARSGWAEGIPGLSHRYRGPAIERPRLPTGRSAKPAGADAHRVWEA